VLGLFGNFNIERVEVRRNIAGFAKHRKMAGELIISNVTI
jgi:hypothetical protein